MSPLPIYSHILDVTSSFKRNLMQMCILKNHGIKGSCTKVEACTKKIAKYISMINSKIYYQSLISISNYLIISEFK